MREITILQSEGKGWRHYFIVTAEPVVVLVDMVPAVFGWNVREIERRDANEDWPDMTRDDIVAWKLRNHNHTVVDAAMADQVIDLVKSKGVAL